MGCPALTAKENRPDSTRAAWGFGLSPPAVEVPVFVTLFFEVVEPVAQPNQEEHYADCQKRPAE